MSHLFYPKSNLSNSDRIALFSHQSLKEHAANILEVMSEIVKGDKSQKWIIPCIDQSCDNMYIHVKGVEWHPFVSIRMIVSHRH